MASTKELALQLVIRAKDEASGALGKVGSALGGIAKIGAVGLGAAAAGITAVGGAVVKMTMDAAKVEGIEKAFNGLVQGNDEMLRSLQKGSGGLITNTDLMMSYNQAAQLVGKSFADQLPDAMGYLQKVAAATGQDMGFMMDSLVKGVGRLSPMILDNLGIQVNLTEANEAYAQTIGKTASELTKQEQQTAMMNMVMSKLAENTANMPEVNDTLASSMQRMKVAWANTTNEIGKAFLPIMAQLAEAVLPIVTQAMQALVPVAQTVADWIGENLPAAIEFLTKLWNTALYPALQLVWAFIERNVIPALRMLFKWIGDHLPGAISTLVSFWNDTLYPALQAIWQFVNDSVIPIFQKLGEGINWVKDTIGWLNEQFNALKDTIVGIPIIGTILEKILPGSLPPLAEGLKMIAAEASKATSALGGMAVPSLGTGAMQPATAGGGGFGGGAMVVNFNYSPAMSLATERETYDVIAPILTEVLRRESRR